MLVSYFIFQLGSYNDAIKTKLVTMIRFCIEITLNAIDWPLHSLVLRDKYDSHRSTSSAFEMRMKGSCAGVHGHFQLACGLHSDLSDSNDSFRIDVGGLVWSSHEAATTSSRLINCKRPTTLIDTITFTKMCVQISCECVCARACKCF